MPQLLREFRLGSGVVCDETGLFVGSILLLERESSVDPTWRPRPPADLERDLSKAYGLPVEVSAKLPGLSAIARALNDGDVVKAQIVALHLRLPDPPALAKGVARTREDIIVLAARLQESGLLKSGWDPSLHPRRPTGSPDSTGGQFSPNDGGGAGVVPGASPRSESGNARLTPAQFSGAIPFPAPPIELPFPEALPLPEEILPPPVGPIILPRNPYPNRPKCVKEWEEADEYCSQLAKAGRLGKHPYRGHGNNYDQCVRGQVTEDCGGNAIYAGNHTQESHA